MTASPMNFERAAVPLDYRLHALEVVGQDVVECLRVEPLAETRRVDDVREQDRDGLPKPLCGLLLERLTAGVARA